MFLCGSLLLGWFGQLACVDTKKSGPSSSIDTSVLGYNIGESYFGSEGFIEYIPGDAPLIFCAPHGGYEKPTNMPDLLEPHFNDSNSQRPELNQLNFNDAIEIDFECISILSLDDGHCVD